MTPEGFEPTIPASERPQTHALDRTATGIGVLQWLGFIKRGVPQGEIQNPILCKVREKLSVWAGGDISEYNGAVYR
jgi:hypothetical protein